MCVPGALGGRHPQGGNRKSTRGSLPAEKVMLAGSPAYLAARVLGHTLPHSCNSRRSHSGYTPTPWHVPYAPQLSPSTLETPHWLLADTGVSAPPRVIPALTPPRTHSAWLPTLALLRTLRATTWLSQHAYRTHYGRRAAVRAKAPSSDRRARFAHSGTGRLRARPNPDSRHTPKLLSAVHSLDFVCGPPRRVKCVLSGWVSGYGFGAPEFTK